VQEGVYTGRCDCSARGGYPNDRSAGVVRGVYKKKKRTGQKEGNHDAMWHERTGAVGPNHKLLPGVQQKRRENEGRGILPKTTILKQLGTVRDWEKTEVNKT